MPGNTRGTARKIPCEPRILHLAKLSFKYEHFLKTLLENEIPASQEIARETSVKGLTISAY